MTKRPEYEFEIKCEKSLSYKSYEEMVDSFKSAFGKDDSSYSSYFKEENSNYVPKNLGTLKRYLFVLTQKDNPVTFAVISYKEGDLHLEIEKFWTNKKYNGCGFGKRLLLYLLKLSCENQKSLQVQ